MEGDRDVTQLAESDPPTNGSAVDGAGVVVPKAATGALTVSMDGQHVWSFRPPLDGRPRGDSWFVPWPPLLVPYLNGATHVQVVDFATEHVYVDEEVVLGESKGDTRIAVLDKNGNPLAVNKAGTLSRAFMATDAAARAEIVEGTRKILDDLHEAGAAAYLNYGALLGAVRNGKMIGHDSDADVCYLSDHDSPVDIILESYRIERAMRAKGYSTFRMSAADFKVALVLSSGREEDVDVFVAFFVGDRFFQLGNRSGKMKRESIVPLGTIELEGVTFPAPADPEAMMAFLYGPSWREPDPSFRYADPADGVRRLNGWLRGFRTEQPKWNRWYLAHGKNLPRHGSLFASWVRSRIPDDAVVADLGCGFGRDTVFFASEGHQVVAFDCAPEARANTADRLEEKGLSGDVRRIQANELRGVMLEGTALALGPQPVVLYARQLINAFDDTARQNIFRLARMVGGSLFVEFSTGEGHILPEGLVGRIDPDYVVRQASGFGGRVVERSDGPGTGMFDQPDHSMTRLHLTFQKETDV
jgi:hypothetical protein